MAARRLGSSLLQRVAAKERRRLMHTEERAIPDSNGKIKQTRILREYPRSEIQQKKEELFTLMCEADKRCVGEPKNRQLMRYLCEHVEPRPDDPRWRRFRRGQLVTNWVTLMGPTSCLLATYLLPENA